MQPILNYLRKQPYWYFLIRFTIFYIIGRILFWGYIGLLYPTGKYYWPFLSDIDLIQLLRMALSYPASWIMDLTGRESIVYNMGVVYSHSRGGIRIEFACLGIQVMIAYAALIIAYAAPKRYLYLFGGILLIHILNVFRMVAIMQMQIHHVIKKISIAHDTFNILAYGAILLLFYIYTKGNEQKV